MSQSANLGSQRAFVNQLLQRDGEIFSTICELDGNTNEIYQKYIERLSYFEKACLLPLNQSDKLLLKSKKEDIFLEFKMFVSKKMLKYD
jgi:hypothetical protein